LSVLPISCPYNERLIFLPSRLHLSWTVFSHYIPFHFIKFSCRAPRDTTRLGTELNLRSKTRLINERDEARDNVLLSPLRSCRARGPLDIRHRTQDIAFTLLNRTKNLPKRIIRQICLAWICLPHPLSRRLQ
jgi:hypothetical protein